MAHTREELWTIRQEAFRLMEETQRQLASPETLSSEALDDLTHCIKQLNIIMDGVNKDLGIEAI